MSSMQDYEKILQEKGQKVQTDKVWVTVISWDLQTAQEKLPYLQHIDWDCVDEEKGIFSPAEIKVYSYKDKEGKAFTLKKMAVRLKGGTVKRFNLQNQDDFDDGEFIDMSTFRYCLEVCMDETRDYATGEIL